MDSRTRTFLTLESLEERCNPDVTVAVDAVTGDLMITGSGPLANDLLIEQVATPFDPVQEYSITNFSSAVIGPALVEAPGNVIIDLNSGFANDSVIVTDLGGIFGKGLGNGLFVNGGAGIDTLNVELVNIPGDVLVTGVNSSDGFLPMFFDTGIGGNLMISNGGENSNSLFDLAFTDVFGSVWINSGNGGDMVILDDSFVGGHMTMNMGNGLFGPDDLTISDTSIVWGNLNFISGASALTQTILIDGSIFGNAYFTLGGNIATDFTLGPDGFIGGNLYVIGGQADDRVFIDGTIDRDVYLNLRGGDDLFEFNTLFSDASINGNFIRFYGGSGNDSVILNGNAGLARFYADMGAGDDDLTLETDLMLQYVFVNFGAGFDTYDDFSSIFIPIRLFNLL